MLGQYLVNELRVGYARTLPFTFQSDFGTQAATSLGIQGINVTEFTTGLPNINVADFTGLSGGPAFLPVNPKQIHYQIEDMLAWFKGRHSLKFGYRFVDRWPSPFTNTDTRSSLTLGRSFVNNPTTNTGGTGLATLLLGYLNGGARGFLIEPYYAAGAGARAVRPGRLQAEPPADRQRRPALRDLRGRDRTGQQDRQLRPGEPGAHLRG